MKIYSNIAIYGIYQPYIFCNCVCVRTYNMRIIMVVKSSEKFNLFTIKGYRNDKIPELQIDRISFLVRENLLYIYNVLLLSY